MERPKRPGGADAAALRASVNADLRRTIVGGPPGQATEEELMSLLMQTSGAHAREWC